MKIILNGARGRMGIEVCNLAKEGYKDSVIAAMVDKMQSDGIYENISDYDGEGDVIIDFSHHTAAKEISEYAVKRNLPLVVCTTGHTEQELEYINNASKSVPVFMSANMSLGIALLAELAKKTAAVFPDADIEIVEKHHNRKLDAPSGTALMLAKAIETVRKGCKFVFGRCGQQKREKCDIGIHSIRGGNIVGEHEVIVCTDTQIITLKHEAQSRSLFAEGAIVAADFICGKSSGMYTMADLTKD